jgi:hypothetical protein
MIQQVPRTNAICPDVVYAAHFEKQILLRLSDFATPNPEVLYRGNGNINLNVQSSGKQSLPRRGGKHVGKFRHALSEVTDSIDEPTLDTEHVVDLTVE